MSAHKRRQLKRKIREYALDKLNSEGYMGEDIRSLALLHLYNIDKDIRDSVKPYKSEWYIWRDIFQPLIGGLNILIGGVKGLGILLWGLVLLPVYCLQYLSGSGTSVRSRDDFKKVCSKVGKDMGLVILDGLAQTLEGVYQVIKTPVTWFIQTPFKLALTVYNGWQPVGENPGMKTLVEGCKTTLNNENQIATVRMLMRFQEKYNKAVSLGQCNKTTVKAAKLNTAAINFSRNLRRDTESKESKIYHRFHMFFGALIEESDCAQGCNLTPSARQYAKEIIEIALATEPRTEPPILLSLL